MNKVFKKIGAWTEPARDWLYWNWEGLLLIGIVILFVVGIIVLALWSAGYFYNEVESYDFTAKVYDKDHYTTQSISYITSGKTRTPVYHTHHHYKVMWEDGGERGVLEVGSDHYNLIKIGDFINIHCSVRADKHGELHYYYNFKGY